MTRLNLSRAKYFRRTQSLPSPLGHALAFGNRTISEAALLVSILVAGTPAPGQQNTIEARDFREAQTLLEQHRPHEARTAALEALRRHPSSVDGYNLLGIIDSNLKDFPDALQAFGKALQMAPNSVKTHNNLGGLYISVGQLGDAEKEFRTVLRIDPTNRDGNYNLGILLMTKKSPGEAIRCFERVRPQDAATQFNLIRAYFAAGRQADALRLATLLSTQSRNDLQVHFSLGTLLASVNQFKPAQLEFEKADALDPESFEILYNLGLVLFREGENAQSEIVLTRALKLKPASTDSLFLLAQVYKNEARPLDALNLLIRARKIAPDNADILLLMARISMSQNFYEDAIPLLQQGVKIAPLRADICLALGESYFISGQIDKALGEFKRLIDIDPSAHSYAFVALSYRSLGRFDEARQYVLKGLALDPHNNACLLNLGFITEAQGDKTGAAEIFQQILRSDPNFPDALMELANIRISEKRVEDAENLLKRYILVAHNPTTGYYKLAIAERTLHQKEAAERDMKTFQTLSHNSSAGPLPFQDIFDYLNNRSELDADRRSQLDIADLTSDIKMHPDQPQDLYFLAEAYLKAGNVDSAKEAVARLDQLNTTDFRTLTGTGVLLARYRLYDDAILQFQQALKANPDSDDVKFNLADAYFRKHLYPQSLDVAQQVSPEEKKDEAYQTLLGDIYSHLDDHDHATEVFRNAIERNPDNDQNYLELALLEFREGNTSAARQTLLKGQVRVPSSGKILWGLGLAATLEGNTAEAAQELERAVDLIPEWPGSYSLLGVFYYQTGQITKAREVLSRFRDSSAHGSLDIDRIEQALDEATPTAPGNIRVLTAEDKSQFLKFALSLADRTL
jgi:tetratricopeptide (TPR) repeat protein